MNPLKLLLIEDDADAAESLRRLLVRTLPAGSSVQTVGTLADGLSQLASTPPDAVLLDLGLPDSDGPDTLARINTPARTVPCVVLTGRDDAELVQQAIDGGVQEYLVKGEFSGPAIARTLRQAIERKRTQLALERAGAENQRWITAVDNASVGMILVDATAPDLPIVFANAAFSRITGYDEKEIMGRNCRFMQGPETDRAVVAQIRGALRQENSFRGELLNYRKDGTTFWNELSVSPVRDPAGRLTHYVGVTNDVTARRETETAFAATQERLSLIVEGALEHGIVSTDLEGMVTSWNPGAEAITRYAAAEVLGRPLDLIFVPDDLAAGVPAREMAEALAAGYCRGEHWHQRRDGSRFWGNCALLPMRERPGGAAVGFIRIFSDETAQLQTRQALERSREELVAALATAERARAEAESANAAKDHFLAVLSHELRTPLTPVLLATHAFGRRRDLSPAVSEAMEMIARNVELEVTFIDEMLDFTRLSRGKLELSRAPMDLHEAIRHAAEVSQPDIGAKRQRLTLCLDASAPRIDGDFARLQQVFWNLLKNASKFTPEGGEIFVRTREGEKPGQLTVEVADTGIGIEPAELPKIFQPFEQANQSIMREFGGLGLGLAIARVAVEAHGGAIGADSPGVGQGTVFTICLPREGAPEDVCDKN